MWDTLLQNLPQTIIVMIAIVICGAEFIKSMRVWNDERKKRINAEVEKQQKELNIQNEFNKLHERFDSIDDRLDSLESRMKKAESQLQDLTISDMHDIKSWIVEQYHKFYVEQGWIDAFSAETLDRRYSDYEKEGGNSYIATLMEQLHSLSMDPKQSIHKKDKEKDELIKNKE